MPSRGESTDIPARQTDYQEPDVVRSPERRGPSEIVGRTPADLVFAFMNRAEFMATLFVFLAFLVSVARLKKASDLWITLAIAVGLSMAWFGSRCLRRLFSPRGR